MSTNKDVLRALAGTLGNDRGGEALVNALLDRYVHWDHDTIDANLTDVINANIFQNTTGYTLELISAKYIPDAAVTANDTNYFTVSVLKGVPGTVTTSAAALATTVAGGSWVADTPVALTLSATFANRKVADGEVVCFDKAVTAAGLKLVAGTLQLKFRIAE